MNSLEIQKGMIVQYWHYSGSRRGCDVNDLIFAKVISFGKVFATLENQYGKRFRISLSMLEFSAEGTKSFQQSVHPTKGGRRL